MSKQNSTPLILKKRLRKVLRRVVVHPYFRYSAIACCALLAVGIYLYIFKDLPNPRGLKNYQVIPLSTQIFDRNDNLLYEVFKDENRVPIDIDTLPDYVKNASIAIEDADFYHHNGISLVGGLLRAVKDSLFSNRRAQGGSTITQQLVKSALLTPERTVRRKIREMVLALWTEKILSKDQILELYLNQIPYGGVSYGIEQASETFFGKHARDLTLAQAAFLARLPQRPSYFNPYTNFARTKAGQEAVLKRMLDLKFITKDQYAKAVKEKIEVISPQNTIKAPHFVFYVKDLLEKQYGEKLITEGGLKVYTTLDLPIQASAEAAVKDEIAKINRINVTNGAALVTRPSTGEILAMVGSVDFFASPSGSFNVTTASRQPGSSIKPINYAIGIDTGKITAATIFNDIPTCFIAPGQPKSYCPKNYDGKYRGGVQTRFALGNSLNIPAVKMMAANGVENFVASSSSFLIHSLKDKRGYGLSLTLGGGEIPMVDMAQAYSTFANEGTPKSLVSILRITDKNDKLIYEYKDPNYKKNVTDNLSYPNFLAIQGKRAISRETAFIISNILSDNGARTESFGPSSQLVVKGKTVSVKTGTTNDIRDNWTIGYTPNFLVAVWVGNNNNTPLSRVASGITGAAPIWNTIMKRVLANQKDLAPRKPDGIVGKEICVMPVGGQLGADGKPAPADQNSGCAKRFEYFIKGVQEGTEIGAYITKEMVPINKDTGSLTDLTNPAMEMQEKTILVDFLKTKHCLDCNPEGRPNSLLNVFSLQEIPLKPKAQ